jgi:predicted permease
MAVWSSLDFKVGFRLLLRYPGLTIVGGLAMAFAIAVSAAAFEIVDQLVDPTLPLDEGDRVVAIRMRDLTTGDYRDQTIADLLRRRESLTTVEQLGAFRTQERNLTLPGGSPEPVRLAEISASGFSVARVAPLMGRTLLEADEQAAAPRVVVISHELWRERFGGDPNVVGREVRIGRLYAAIVGVMPEGFAFPVAHRLWLPLRLDQATLDQAPVNIFGRLAADATFEKAQAEAATTGVQSAEPGFAAQQQMRLFVEPYALSYGISLDAPPELRASFYAVNLFFVMLLGLICANVALLMFARAVSREGEIVVRNALGASRGRIVTQLFAEGLVLGCTSTLIGLGAAYFALNAFYRVYQIESEGRLPFWFEPRLSPATMLYAVALAFFAAAIAGVLPALKVTGRRVDARLRQLTPGGGGLTFGRFWIAVIIVQVAVTVTFPAGAFFVRSSVIRTQSIDVGFAAEQYLSARLEPDRENADARSFSATTRELTRRLEDEPGVFGVTLADRLPRMQHPAQRIELEADAATSDTPISLQVAKASVDLNYFDVLGARVLAGRAFHSGDRNNGAQTVIVDESFVQRVLGGRNPLGRRIRYIDGVADRRQSYEIVGVVNDLGMVDPGVYHALTDDAFPLHVAVHLREDPSAFAPRLRALAGGVDPGLQLHNVTPLNALGAWMWLEFNFLFQLLGWVSAIALVLSLAGIYAVTSFTVSRRTREIGIRVALGADAGRVLAAILARTVTYVGIGILAGACMTGALAYGVMQGALGLAGGAVIVTYAVLMMGVCLLACVAPVRRALRVQPTEALRQN